jgi:hypothetical protein
MFLNIEPELDFRKRRVAQDKDVFREVEPTMGYP